MAQIGADEEMAMASWQEWALRRGGGRGLAPLGAPSLGDGSNDGDFRPGLALGLLHQGAPSGPAVSPRVIGSSAPEDTRRAGLQLLGNVKEGLSRLRASGDRAAERAAADERFMLGLGAQLMDDYTPESVSEFGATRDLGVLRRRPELERRERDQALQAELTRRQTELGIERDEGTLEHNRAMYPLEERSARLGIRAAQSRRRNEREDRAHQRKVWSREDQAWGEDREALLKERSDAERERGLRLGLLELSPAERGRQSGEELGAQGLAEQQAKDAYELKQALARIPRQARAMIEPEDAEFAVFNANRLMEMGYSSDQVGRWIMNGYSMRGLGSPMRQAGRGLTRNGAGGGGAMDKDGFDQAMMGVAWAVSQGGGDPDEFFQVDDNGRLHPTARGYQLMGGLLAHQEALDAQAEEDAALAQWQALEPGSGPLAAPEGGRLEPMAWGDAVMAAVRELGGVDVSAPGAAKALEERLSKLEAGGRDADPDEAARVRGLLARAKAFEERRQAARAKDTLKLRGDEGDPSSAPESSEPPRPGYRVARGLRDFGESMTQGLIDARDVAENYAASVGDALLNLPGDVAAGFGGKEQPRGLQPFKSMKALRDFERMTTDRAF